MNTENLHRTLSPEAYAAFREGIKARAIQARRVSIQQLGLPKLHRLVPRAGLFSVLTLNPPKEA